VFDRDLFTFFATASFSYRTDAEASVW